LPAVQDRLGWIDAPRCSLDLWPRWAALAQQCRRDGLERALVCGMGGSSLAPEVLARSFDRRLLQVLDSTDPAAVLAAERAGALERTVFVIASKSGTTTETLAFYRYFAARARSDQFVAVTDPGTPLERLARDAGFRATLPHPPDVGGRFAALTVVGMLPAALAGIDGRTLLERATTVDPARARAFGSRLAAAVRAGRDKLLLEPPKEIAALAHWIEQLVAESSGKSGTGMIPVLENGVAARAGDHEIVAEFSSDPLDLGIEFQFWMHATVELCRALGVNPFDQPDVEAAKALARSELERGAPAEAPSTRTPAELRDAARAGDYVAILAFLPPFVPVAGALERVRAAWARATGCAATVGVGPRYLHATGQLHKGGPNKGLFLVITADDPEDAGIPGSRHTFGDLKRAQAVGDIRALLDRGRRVAHVHCSRWEEVQRLEEVR
jgi:hypothetical protein